MLTFADAMNTFMGTYTVKLDEKGRIFIPAGYRKMLVEMGQRGIVLRKDTDNACLIVYPEAVWNKKVEALSETLNEWDPEDNMLLTQFMAEAEQVEMDSQGRVLLQKKNLQLLSPLQLPHEGESTKRTSELLIVGMRDRFAIWDKETFEASMMDSRDFAARLKERMRKA